MERKVLSCEISFKELAEDGQFEGHAAIFNNIDLGGDRIKRAAFKRTIEETGGKWPVLMGHLMARPVGFSTGAEEDSKGLKVYGEFTLGSDDGRNAYALPKHAARLRQPFGLSIGYGIPEGGSKYNGETGVRDLTDITVHEFSLAAGPLNPRARIGTVKAAGEPLSEREIEAILRDVGLSQNDAKCIIHSLRNQRDVETSAPLDAKLAQDFHALINAAGVIHEYTSGLEKLRNVY